MCDIPVNCSICPYENSCNTYYNAPDCHFHGCIKNRITLWDLIKKIFKK